MKVLIVGAGIGGLTAALTLQAVGIHVTVIDAVNELRPLGVGINLLPHATGELAKLGLYESLADVAIPTAECVHLDRFGSEIWREPRGLAAGHTWPQYSVHRGEFQMLLLNAVCDRLGPDTVRTGMRFESATQNADGVRVRIHDRMREAVVEMVVDAVIGADGIHSVVRTRLRPGEGAPLWNGIRMWRGITDARPFLSGASMVIAGSNHAAKFVAYPISAAARRRGRALVNWVAEVKVSDTNEQASDWNRAGRLEDVLPHYVGWQFDGLDVSELMAASATILEYPMVDRNPLSRWTDGRITLLGDAAHPMYPIGSNGGSQAIIDAGVLARELAARSDPSVALDAYETARRDTVNATVLANRDMPMDRVLRLVADRAPHGFDRIEEVLTAREIDAIGRAYQHTSR
ncbi:flavin-dependent oxidoreductase [Nocardia sp. NPDC049220]|uniref:flavin-dependent oxidoreductase n=1 Tax=Nocardia sp. NPDC049220 TaxID=3155273 RepID=UPI0033D638F7